MIGVEASCPIMSEKEESEALNNVMMRAFVKMSPLVMCAPLLSVLLLCATVLCSQKFKSSYSALLSG